MRALGRSRDGPLRLPCGSDRGNLVPLCDASSYLPKLVRRVFPEARSQVAARAMQSKTAHIFYDQLFVKEPGTSAATPWHNDTSYWHIEGDQVCSIWVALDEVPRERGLSYVRGSHKWNLTHRITNFSGAAHSGKNTYEGAAELPPVPDVAGIPAEDMLNWDMQPGDALLFYSAMLHGAPGVPGGSPHRRRGYATRWCGDDIRFVDKPGTMNAGWKVRSSTCRGSGSVTVACRDSWSVTVSSIGRGLPQRPRGRRAHCLRAPPGRRRRRALSTRAVPSRARLLAARCGTLFAHSEAQTGTEARHILGPYCRSLYINKPLHTTCPAPPPRGFFSR